MEVPESSEPLLPSLPRSLLPVSPVDSLLASYGKGVKGFTGFHPSIIEWGAERNGNSVRTKSQEK